MPFGKVSKTTVTKMIREPRYQAPRKSKVRRTRPMSQQSPFPAAKFMKLRYADNFNGAGITTTPAGVQIVLNNLNDLVGTLTGVTSAVSAGGHQPYYYDQIRPMYGKYIVYKTRITVRAMHTGYTLTVLRDNSDNSTSPSNILLEAERPNAVSAVCSGNAGAVILSKTFDLPKLAGLSKKEYFADPAYSGTGASSGPPTGLLYANITSQYLDNSTSFTAQMNVIVDTWVKFYDPEQVAQS